jgi:hypothetical protein
MKPGVNYCHCPCCHTEFFFDKEDITIEEYVLPKVVCPYCKQGVSLGIYRDFFTYKENSEEKLKISNP